MRINMLFILSLVSITACNPAPTELNKEKSPEELLEEQQRQDQALELEAEQKLLKDSQVANDLVQSALEESAELEMQQSEGELMAIAAEKQRLAEQQLIETANKQTKELDTLLQQDEQQ
ncbi:hypothetical protein Q4574_16100 [Aliiglaciecola sp. 3_MG-2023]|uniref:hypothetical protein n=1 Tax=Aliiglaciecola sp. 3_MG-2023 TaxID=3062644 RepID=UPI0026E3F583|nr:hypothetical protein [Aliiglaciecola sp. 3_MG-2023]MDO6694820.1 hypothetical protein [Aliiglaciecola sp. 3_MG-2023]